MLCFVWLIHLEPFLLLVDILWIILLIFLDPLHFFQKLLTMLIAIQKTMI